MTRSKSLLLIALTFLIGKLSAQTDMTLYNIRAIPQVMYTNPGIMPSSRVNIGLPVISSIYMNGFNSGFTYKDLIRLKGDSLYIDPDNLIKKMGKTNVLGFHTNIDLLSFGFRVKENYFSFNCTEKMYARLSYPRDFMSLLWKGNGAFLGTRADLDKFGMDASHYREFGLGYARYLLDGKLSVGGKIKYLNGMQNLYTKRSNLGLTTNAENYSLETDAEFIINAAGTPFYNQGDTAIGLNDQYYNDPKSMIFGKNHGVALDLGANYKINDKFRVSGSILDIGFIKWKNDVVNLNVPKTSFTFEGVDVKDLIPKNSKDSTNTDSTTWDQKLLDSLKSQVNYSVSNNKYTSPLITRFYVGGNYNLNESNDVGLLFYGEFYRGMFRPAVTASINSRVGRVLSTSLSWSYMNRSFANVGLGVSLNLGPLQWYMVMDNILAPFIPYATKNLHMHAGFNLTFGRERKDKDRDGIMDKEDKCPDVPGPEEFAGCPDRDGDKIIDINDKCPDVKGVPEFSGCPDTDLDGVVDSLDECVTEKGLVEFNGCPDRDNDKIIDKRDSCPDQAGPKTTQGCPDKDNDLVIDSKDLCPEKFGEPAHAGCPDSDADGLYDNEDRCPETAGPTENFGCPYGDLDGDGTIDKEDRCPDTPGPAENKGCPWSDTDADGVTDNIDECPLTPGPADNKGCPVLSKAEEEVLKTAFDNLEFESGKAVIKAVSYPSLDTLAAYMVRKPEWKLKIAGHTDNVGEDKANMTLSKNRAEAVKTYLKMKGVTDDARFTVEGYGETKPIAPNNTPEGRQKNRRVEMTVVFE